MAARSSAWVCGRPPSGIVGSNLTRGMEVCLLWVLCVVSTDHLVVVSYRSLRLADHSARGVLLSVVCLRVILNPRYGGSPGPLGPFTPWDGGRIVLLKLFSDRWPQIFPSRAECRSALVYAIGVQPFHGKGPNPLLWAGSRGARGRQQMIYLTAYTWGDPKKTGFSLKIY